MMKKTERAVLGALAMIVVGGGCSDPLQTRKASLEVDARLAGTGGAIVPVTAWDAGAVGSNPDTAGAGTDSAAVMLGPEVAWPMPGVDARAEVPWSLPDGFIPPVNWGWGDAGADAYDELCGKTPNLSQGSCHCLPNPDFLRNPAIGVCSGRPAGQTCTQDCCGTCGLASERGVLSSLRRPCVNGTYAAAECPPPVGWRKGLVGGACSPPMEYGTTATFTSGIAQGMPCNQEWGVCFTLGDSKPGMEMGCACLWDERTGLLKLACGQVYGWFKRQGEDWAFASGLIWKTPSAVATGP